jgi:HSP20 family protein
MRSEFERMLGQHYGVPPVDMIREDGRLIVRAEVPGSKPEEIEIKVDSGTLTISGSHEEASEEHDKEFVHRERRFGAFSRTLALPEAVDAKKIKATVHDGVLEITLPLHRETEAQPMAITPTAGD